MANFFNGRSKYLMLFYSGMVLMTILYCWKILLSPISLGASNSRPMDVSYINLDNNYIQQKFVVNGNRLDAIRISLKSDYSNTLAGNIQIKLSDNDSVYQEWNINKYNTKENNYYTLWLTDKIINMNGKEFDLSIQGENSACSIGVTNSIINNAEKIYINGEQKQQTLSFFQITHYIKIKIVFVLVLFMILVGTLLVTYIGKKYNRIELVFAFIYVVIAIVSFFVIMPFTSPDEYNHFARAYEISEGHVASFYFEDSGMVGRNLPKAVSDFSECFPNKGLSKFYDLEPSKGIMLNKERKAFIFPNTSLYAPTNYLPQVIGIVIMRLLTKNMLFIFWGARFIGTILIGFMLYYAISIIPFGKLLIFAISFLPMSIQQYNSYSSDAWCNAITVLFISMVFKWISERTKKFCLKEYVYLYFFVASISLTKIVYLPLLLLLFLIPIEKFGTLKNYLLVVVSAVTLAALLWVSWNSLTSVFLTSYTKGLPWSVYPKLQIAYIMSNPIHFLKLMIDNFNQRAGYLWDIMGFSLGWFNINIDFIIILSYFIMLIIASFEHEKEAYCINSIKCKSLLVFIIVIIYILMNIALYATWTSYHAQFIDGIQGRYFIPLLPLLCLLLKSNKVTEERNLLKFKFSYIFIIFCLCCCTITTFLSNAI